MSKQIADYAEELGTAFDEFKQKHNARLESVEARLNRERIGPDSGVAKPEGLTILAHLDRSNGPRAALSEGGTGAEFVPEEYAKTAHDRLAAASVGMRSGLTVIETVRDVLHIPTVTSDQTAAWVAEAGTISPSDGGYADTQATVRKLAALQVVSNEILADSNPAILAQVEMQLIRSLALKLDLGIFEGSGTAPEIRGVKNKSGITEVSMGVNGAALTNLDPFADAIGALAEDNAAASAIVMHPRTWKSIMKLKEQTTGNNKPLVQTEAGGVGAAVERSLYGVPVYLSSQLSIAETQGTETAASSAYVYQANQGIVVRRQAIRVEVDRSRLFNSDQSEIRAIARFDFVIPNAPAFVRILGIAA